MSDTIAAIATGGTISAIGIVRVSGPGALAAADAVFRPADGRPMSAHADRLLVYGRLLDARGRVLDLCLCTVSRAPHSYTGEDVVELSCHGGLYLLRRVLRAVLAAGARPAGAGEFTRRAFLNGKLDLTRAEAVMELIAADGRLSARTALAAREGNLYRRMETVKNELVGLSAHFSAYVDYPDEDIPALDEAALDGVLARAEESLSSLLATYDAGRVLREGVDTVIVGSPNVGKSTLMNWLAGCERSIVTPVAGTTRDVVEETVRLGDVVLRLSDTAGIRETNDAVESIGVQRARQRMEQAAPVR